MEPVFYEIDTEVPKVYMEKLLEFIHQKYLIPQKERFSGIAKKRSDTGSVLSYSILDAQRNSILQVEVKASQPLAVKITPFDQKVTETTIEEAKQDIVIATQIFEENARKSTLYFAWREGEKIVPETVGKGEKSVQRLFLETQVLFFILFTGFGVVLFILVALYYPQYFLVIPVILVAAQFIFVFYSTWFIARTGDWKITKDNPTIHFLEYHLPLMENGEFRKSYPPEKLAQIKREVYDEILAKHGEINCSEASRVFEKYGVSCEEDNLTSKRVNVYELVKKIADKFGYPMPKIVVSNTIMPNAAASGPSPTRGLVLITTGLLVQLEEKEIESVLGHEFGHLKGRDPLILYGITSAEFLFRFYVLLTFFPIVFQTFLFFVYIWVVFSIIFFIAKFFEARADLISAVIIGQPEILASALEKIGFQRLLFERTPSFRLQEWIGFDPHPPIYFRVDRLAKLRVPVKVKYPLLRSIREVFSGLFAAL
ncbi:MAG TPA: M56 family metallopeptidase [Candidatus Sulfotelmatobacter sp.]|jgi:heat shock protein HtpX|nr:M56 family metallopeptidase [Candidatus Sulfotelmatobacter sp.]